MKDLKMLKKLLCQEVDKKRKWKRSKVWINLKWRKRKEINLWQSSLGSEQLKNQQPNTTKDLEKLLMST